MDHQYDAESREPACHVWYVYELTVQSTLYTQAVDMLIIYFTCDRIVACGQQIVACGEEQRKWRIQTSIESRKIILKNAFKTKSLKPSEIHISIDFCKV